MTLIKVPINKNNSKDLYTTIIPVAIDQHILT